MTDTMGLVGLIAAVCLGAWLVVQALRSGVWNASGFLVRRDERPGPHWFSIGFASVATLVSAGLLALFLYQRLS